ncbi:hypothetical protein C8F04DRAFT_1302052 [Mycena alexandri]|uniref:B box-type domain-containing protein n=1 Tax=Mycena alexandri TaxID=1745969 RepID=A0AAD6SB21_9AGAR|nr:hypothetical protein C8F04DRAFT_1302052 [Mycena alexandri]
MQTSARSLRPLPKRRRLNPLTPYTAQKPTELNAAKIAPKTAGSICASCHRAATASAILFCSRCSSPTCAVCSRTCNATLSDASLAPRLSASSTPMYGFTPTPRRSVLALNAANTNANANAAPAAVKRKKPRDSDEDRLEGREPCDNSTDGCGRIICRACCLESSQESTTTCYDCDRRSPI